MTELILKKIHGSNDIETDELMARYDEITSSNQSQTYIALAKCEEIGLLVIDPYENEEFSVLYELLVPSLLRRKGNGTKILKKVEILCLKRGKAMIKLCPEPYLGDVDKADLIKWYQNRGYSMVPDHTGDMYKIISRDSS